MQIRLLDKYIFREVCLAFFFGICGTSAVFVGSGTLFRIAQYITEYGASFGSVVKMFIFSLPAIAIYTFPMSMLLLSPSRRSLPSLRRYTRSTMWRVSRTL